MISGLRTSTAGIRQLAAEFLALALLLLSVPDARPAVQPTAPLDFVDVMHTKTFGLFEPVQFSPDADWLAYTVSTNCRPNQNQSSADRGWRTGVWPYQEQVEIFVADLRGNSPRNLTGCEGESWSPQWSPDGRYLAFVSDRDGSGSAKLWIWDRNRDQLRKLSDENVRTEQHHIRWLRSGRGVLVAVLPAGITPDAFARRFSTPKSQNGPGSLPGVSAVVYRSASPGSGESPASAADPWNLDAYLADLAVVDLATGSLTRLTRDEHVGSYALSPDGRELAFTSAERFEKAGSQQILWSLRLVSVAGNATRTLASALRLDYDGSPFSWSPDGRQLAYLAAGQGADQDGVSDCFLVDENGGSPRNITNFPKRDPHSSTRRLLWNATADSLFLVREGGLWRVPTGGGGPVALPPIRGRKIVEVMADEDNLVRVSRTSEILVLTDDELAHQSGFYRINLATGASREELEEGKCYNCANVEPRVTVARNARRLAFFSEDAEHPGDLWTADPGLRNPRRVTRLNPQLDRYQMGKSKLVTWRDLDGNPLAGALFLPANYQEGKRYPLVVYIYGGSRGSRYLNHFGGASSDVLNLQLLATRGFAVFFPDAPQRLGTPMSDLAKTVLPGVNELVRMGIADGDRIGILGHSYGGYSVLSLLVASGRFKAAVMVDGKADLVAEYGSMTEDGSSFGISINEGGQGLMGGTPWENRERYIENSPIFYLDRVQTPLLVIHGAEDQAVPVFLADEVFVDLRRLGKTVEYARYRGEGHVPGLWSDANKLDYYQRVISWLERYLR